MHTFKLLIWYFGELQKEKKQNDFDLQAVVQEINKRKFAAKDVKIGTLSIVSMKVIHDKISQTTIKKKRKQVILDPEQQY